ncbi:hypothetical protein FACS1894172_12110 [Spirochaetia bacterium]|nr:hypothetical protein FACS1894164_01880 [Spirochaetia bacterium]GHU33488.1 hypothetical protein FACS1894172_12110 [Spirochaetia bacterium]
MMNSQTLLYRFLSGIIIILILILAAGTVYAFFFRSTAQKPFVRSGTQPESTPDYSVPFFTEIGRIRAQTADSTPVSIIVTPVFPHIFSDQNFTEEVRHTIPAFRSATQEYFHSLPAFQIRNRSEESIKTDLLSRYNALLRLGRIETLYFEDFLFIE